MGDGAEMEAVEVEMHGAGYDAAENVRLKIGNVEAFAVGVIAAARIDAGGVKPLEVEGDLLGGVAAGEGQLTVGELAVAAKIGMAAGDAGIVQDGAQVLKIEMAAIAEGESGLGEIGDLQLESIVVCGKPTAIG